MSNANRVKVTLRIAYGLMHQYKFTRCGYLYEAVSFMCFDNVY